MRLKYTDKIGLQIRQTINKRLFTCTGCHVDPIPVATETVPIPTLLMPSNYRLWYCLNC